MQRSSSSSLASTMLALILTAITVITIITKYDSKNDTITIHQRQLAVPQEAPSTTTATLILQAAPSLTTAIVTTKYQAGQLPGAESSNGYKEITGSHFPGLIAAATAHKRGRKMNDLTKDPPTNSLQTLLNTWTDGSYSPVHKHLEYAESFTALDGALAFFTFTETGDPTCHVLHDGKSG